MDIFDQIAAGVRPPPPPSAHISEALPSLQEQPGRTATKKLDRILLHRQLPMVLYLQHFSWTRSE